MNKKENNSQNSLVIDVQSLFIPLSVIVVGVMISGALYFGLKSSNNSSNSVNDKVSAGTVKDEDAADAPDDVPDEPTTATTSIDDDPIMGNKDSAKVAIIEFADYECPFCQRHFEETLGDIKEKYIDTGKAIYVYRDLPLSFHDPAATDEAQAAECVQDLAGDDAYFKYHDLIFENTKANGEGVGGADKLAKLASQVGLDVGAFNDCFDSEKFKEEVEKDASDAQSASISGTPGFVIGLLQDDGTVEGTVIRGAFPFSEFERVIDDLI